MPLVTFQTRLSELLREAQAIRAMCQQSISAMATGSVSANTIVGISQRINAAVTNILEPAQAHTGLAAYAAQQFGDANFGLDQRMAGLALLLRAAITACRATIPTSNGYVLKDQWNADGSVSVRALTPQETAALRVALQAVVDAIPE